MVLTLKLQATINGNWIPWHTILENQKLKNFTKHTAAAQYSYPFFFPNFFSNSGRSSPTNSHKLHHEKTKATGKPAIKDWEYHKSVRFIERNCKIQTSSLIAYSYHKFAQRTATRQAAMFPDQWPQHEQVFVISTWTGKTIPDRVRERAQNQSGITWEEGSRVHCI